MKTIKNTLKTSLIACSLICLSILKLHSMEEISVQQHLNWLRTVNHEAHVDAAKIVKNMCYVSRYLGNYGEYHYLKKPEEALGYLSDAKDIFGKMAKNIDALCSNQKEPALITGYKAMNALKDSDENKSAWSKAYNFFKICRPQSLSIGQDLTVAFQYLDMNCSQLKKALETLDAQSSITIMQKLSYNTQLLFSALNGKGILERFTSRNGCKDEQFYRMVQKIISSFAMPPIKMNEEINAQKEHQKAYANWIRNTFAVPIEAGVKVMGEVGVQPDLSNVARLLLNPRPHEKFGISLAENHEWLRNRMGSNGAAIGKAMDEGKPITGIMADLEKNFPTALRPLTLSLLNNYGQTVINPLAYFICLSRFPLISLTKKTNRSLQYLDNYGALPSLEEQLYPYLTTLGSSFYTNVSEVLKVSNHGASNKLAEKFELNDDSILLHKYDKKRNKLKKVEKIHLYLEEGSSRSKRVEDEKVTLRKKLKILEDVLEKRGYQVLLLPQKNGMNEKLPTLKDLNELKKLKEESLDSLNKSLVTKQEQLDQCQENIKTKREIIGNISEAAGWLCMVKSTYRETKKNLELELHVLENKEKILLQEINSIEDECAECRDEIAKYNESIQYKERLKELRDFLSNDYLQNLFKDSVISDQNFLYCEELVAINRKEFHKVLKKFYKKNNSMTENDAQDIFNAWVLYLLDRQKDLHNEGFQKEYGDLLHDMARKYDKKQCKLNAYRQKDIREVWSSYTLSMKVAAWIAYFKHGHFPIYTDKLDASLKEQESVYQKCFENYEALSNKGAFKDLKEILAHEALLNQRQEHHIKYTIIKFLLSDEIKTMPYVKILENIHFKEKEKAKKFRKPIQPLSKRMDTKKVERQTGAKCGEHAVFNALKSLELVDVELSQFLKDTKKIIVESREARNDYQWKGHEHWLSEEEIITLLDHYAQEKPMIHNSVIFLPDVKKYLLGLGGLDQKTIEQIAEVHDLIDNNEDFERTYIVCTAGEVNSYRGGNYDSSQESQRNVAHWIAIKQIGRKNQEIRYEIMDSAPGANLEKLKKDLDDLMMKARGFKKMSDMEFKKYEALLTEIAFSKAFYDGFYAMKTKNKKNSSENSYEKSQEQLAPCWIDRVFKMDNPVEIDDVPVGLVQRILNACFELLHITQGEHFHCVNGRIEPFGIIKKVLDVLKERHQKNSIILLTYLENYNENTEPLRFQLTLEQLSAINALEETIKGAIIQSQQEHTNEIEIANNPDPDEKT